MEPLITCATGMTLIWNSVSVVPGTSITTFGVFTWYFKPGASFRTKSPCDHGSGAVLVLFNSISHEILSINASRLGEIFLIP